MILGGGRKKFYNETETDVEEPNQTGDRTDGRNLIEEWQEGKINAHYVWNKEQFDAISDTSTDYLLGKSTRICTKYLFSPSFLAFISFFH